MDNSILAKHFEGLGFKPNPEFGKWITVGNSCFFSWSLSVRQELIEVLGEAINLDGGWWATVDTRSQFNAAGIVQYDEIGPISKIECIRAVREALEQNYHSLSRWAKEEISVYGRVAFSKLFTMHLKNSGIDIFRF